MQRKVSAIAGLFAVILIALAIGIDSDPKTVVDFLAAVEEGASTDAETEPHGHSSPALPDELNELGTYTVKRVVDGDTLVVTSTDEEETVRLIGVDTPESVHPTQPVECFGAEAAEFLKSLLSAGSHVHLYGDPSQDTRDRYGRLLAYVFLHDGQNANEVLIAEGYGHEYTYESAYYYQDQFQKVEKTARDEGRGLWAAGVCQ